MYTLSCLVILAYKSGNTISIMQMQSNFSASDEMEQIAINKPSQTLFLTKSDETSSAINEAPSAEIALELMLWRILNLLSQLTLVHRSFFLLVILYLYFLITFSKLSNIYQTFFVNSEAFRPPSFRGESVDKYGFHIGRYKNFQEVFGDNPKTWFLPISTRYLLITFLSSFQ